VDTTNNTNCLYIYNDKAEDITTEKQVSLRATEVILPPAVALIATELSDIATGGGTNSHQSDIATYQIT